MTEAKITGSGLNSVLSGVEVVLDLRGRSVGKTEENLDVTAVQTSLERTIGEINNWGAQIGATFRNGEGPALNSQQGYEKESLQNHDHDVKKISKWPSGRIKIEG